MASSTNRGIYVSQLQQQIAVILKNSSVVVKSILVATCSLYVVSFLGESILNTLAITPGFVIPPNFRIWTYITHGFLETHIWNVVTDIITLIACGKLIEPLWGALEMLLFCFIVNIGVGLTSAVWYLMIYVATSNIDYLFQVHIHGLAGYIAGITVALKQTMGDYDVINTSLLKMRVKHISLWLVLWSILLFATGFSSGVYPLMTCTGIIVSWVYLRFYQKQSDGSRGDMSDTFTFATFFPEKCQPPIAILANTVHSGLVKARLCKKQVRKYDVGAPSSITISLPGSDANDAERRRQLALRALNERLSRVEEQASWPSMDEQPATTTGTTATTTTASDSDKNKEGDKDKESKKGAESSATEDTEPGETESD
ncbi:transmembrane protein 115-like [Saccoglossus kowalevskii]|uniref:Transmembrane protein 115-like n=1 Tax=Saccoglossus kowalevskii TaxID=10224 RepID=A0ABM0GVJ7_SACKO|nr:PREDICTED: transmembrane protein 115-like [Saccoglossus kowalevskii]